MDERKFHISFRKLWERRQRTIKEAKKRAKRGKQRGGPAVSKPEARYITGKPAFYHLAWMENEFDDNTVYTGRLVNLDVDADHYWIDPTDRDDVSKGYSVHFIRADDDSAEMLGENLSPEAAQELAERHLAGADADDAGARS